LERILIVDWDYHHGNGTEAAFYDDPGVLFFSTHDINAYPGTGHSGDTGSGAGKGYTINVPLGCGATDADIIAAFRDRLLPAATDFKPEFILISAGFDSRESDLLGCYDITDAGFAELTRMMLELADQHCAGRLVSILEGGYNLQGNASAAAAHVGELVTG
ncbi:MAG: histone deacetylase, partial [Gammaproteobacteria bacterium]